MNKIFFFNISIQKNLSVLLLSYMQLLLHSFSNRCLFLGNSNSIYLLASSFLPKDIKSPSQNLRNNGTAVWSSITVWRFWTKKFILKFELFYYYKTNLNGLNGLNLIKNVTLNEISQWKNKISFEIKTIKIKN